MNDETRKLANGEVWELRAFDWHMVGYIDGRKWDTDDYAPVSAENFDSYAECIEAGERRR